MLEGRGGLQQQPLISCLSTAIRRYGKDFTAIAEVIGTKTAAQVSLYPPPQTQAPPPAHIRPCPSFQVSSFFVSYRRRFNLDEVLREWAAEQVATSRDPRRGGEEMAPTADGGAEEEEVRKNQRTCELERIAASLDRSGTPEFSEHRWLAVTFGKFHQESSARALVSVYK